MKLVYFFYLVMGGSGLGPPNSTVAADTMGDVNAWDVAADGALYSVHCTLYSIE